MTVGSGATRRTVPLHTIASHLSSDLLHVLPAMHHLTGSDYTSKVGRGKRVALSVHPEKYLTDFACGIFPYFLTLLLCIRYHYSPGEI